MIFAAALCLATLTVSAQDVREIEWTVSVDEFTGDTVVTSGLVSLHIDLTMTAPSIDAFFSRIDTLAVLQVQFTHSESFYLFRGDPLYLRTEGGNVVELESMVDAYPDKSGPLYMATGIYQIDRGGMELINREGLGKIRAVLHDQQFDCDVNEAIKPRVGLFFSQVVGWL